MDQEDTMDFKALRAKFQDEEILLKKPKFKPAVPEKPKVVPPPHSPTHHLPAGARPSLLTSISQIDGKTAFAPRVVFKEDQKESKKPLIQPTLKTKEKSEGKLKLGKDKSTKGSKEKLDADGKTDLLDKKPKKESGKDKKLLLVFPVASKGGTAELVPATPPPKPTTPKKKPFFAGLKKSVKKGSAEIPADPILDAPSPDISGPTPLVPTNLTLGKTTPEPPVEIQTPKAVTPPNPTFPDYSSLAALTPPSFIPDPPNNVSQEAFIPDIPAPDVPSLEMKTPSEIETPAIPVSVSPRPTTPTPVIPAPSSPAPSPRDACTQLAVPGPPSPAAPTPSPPSETEVSAAAGVAAAEGPAVEESPPPGVHPPSAPSSPKAERPVSAMSALERAEEMNPGKRTSPCDQRVFNALEKARKKLSPLNASTTSYSVTPAPEELHPPVSPTCSLPDLPPIDYDDQAANAKAAQVNGFDHRQPSPMLEGITEEGSDVIPELLDVPPPPPRKSLPDPQSLGPTPVKPARPPSADQTAYLPPPLEDNAVEIPAPPEFSETDTSMEVPEFEDVGSDATELHSLELPVSEWGNGEYVGADGPEEHTVPETMTPEFYSNGITDPEAEDYGVPRFGAAFHEIPESDPALDVLDSSSPLDVQPITVPQAEHGAYEIGENVYEDVSSSATKKKGKSEAGKKRKGPPKNPYAETSQPTNEEKSKTIRFGRNDRKTSPEGPDEKELKKKEKQRLEKEKKELKEQKEREKKEQKEREKRENEMKKKFKITGQEEAMYQATVCVTTKGRKNDLPVTSGDTVSIIRTTNCPKGKWLARNSSNTYGYIAVDHVELDIKEMLQLGKKAAVSHKNSSDTVDAERTSMGSRTSNHYPLSTGSFTDDSEEWTNDDDEPPSSPTEPIDPPSPQGHSRTHSMPELGDRELNIVHQHSHSDISTEGPYIHARHEALQKLATFFHSPKTVIEEPTDGTEATTSPVFVEEELVCLPESSSTEEVDVELPDMLILPPPDLYADILTVE
ncbi:uncharacterized protein ACJ7VT_001673 [Polymixia lowei]